MVLKWQTASKHWIDNASAGSDIVMTDYSALFKSNPNVHTIILLKNTAMGSIYGSNVLSGILV